MVEEVYRAKSEELGPGTYRFVAEIEFSGTRVVERYLDQGDGAKREQLHGVFRSAVEEGNGSGDPRALDAALNDTAGGLGAAAAVHGELDATAAFALVSGALARAGDANFFDAARLAVFPCVLVAFDARRWRDLHSSLRSA